MENIPTELNEEDMKELEELHSFTNMGTTQSKIQLMHSVYPLHTLVPILQDQIADVRLKKEIETIVDEINAGVTCAVRKRIRKMAINYRPKTINNLIWLYKLGAAEFFIENSTFDMDVLNVFNYIFKIKVDFDQNPLHMHLIVEAIMSLECLHNSNRNKIYLAKTISTLSRLALYLSVCINWSVFFSIIRIEQKMYRFYKFSELVRNVVCLDVAQFWDRANDFHILLECISYLLNTVTAKNLNERIDTSFMSYFKYNEKEMNELRNWCIAANRKFDIKVSENKFVSDNSLISDLLELDILVRLDNLKSEEAF